VRKDLFITLLCLERKRSERSGNHFALALLDVARLDDVFPLREALCSQLRETDLPGWYLEHSVLGVIFTTLNGAPVDLIRSKLLSKMDNALKSARSKVPVTLLIYPEDITNELYPDIFTVKSNSHFRVMKRVIDVAGSLTALILLAPVFLVITALVKLSSPGPVLFKQKRLGLLGKQFEFLKFRTMYANNDPEIHKKYVEKLILNQQKSSGVYKIQNDPRVTWGGRFLRKSSLDELPQFVNVLKGDMSLVGPRPPLPYEVEKYRSWHLRRVLEVKPGLTGLWQVQGRSRTTFDEMVRMDIQYIRQQSGWLDFKIVLKTPRAVLSGTGAY
jgi:lipopolysaccharide/colanic/teichoic acid biosynthesis glycosyltransferase